MKAWIRLKIIYYRLLNKLGLSNKIAKESTIKKYQDMFVFKKKGHIIKLPNEEQKEEVYKIIGKKIKNNKFSIVDNRANYQSDIFNVRPIDIIDTIAISYSCSVTNDTVELLKRFMKNDNIFSSKEYDTIPAHFIVHRNGIIEYINDINRFIPGVTNKALRTIHIIIDRANAAEDFSVYINKRSIVKLIAFLCIGLKIDPLKGIYTIEQLNNKFPKKHNEYNSLEKLYFKDAWYDIITLKTFVQNQIEKSLKASLIYKPKSPDKNYNILNNALMQIPLESIYTILEEKV